MNYFDFPTTSLTEEREAGLSRVLDAIDALPLLSTPPALTKAVSALVEGDRILTSDDATDFKTVFDTYPHAGRYRIDFTDGSYLDSLLPTDLLFLAP